MSNDSKMSKSDFKQFMSNFRQAGDVKFIDSTGRVMNIDEFCGEVSRFDPQAASKLKTWHQATKDLGDHVESRCEGPVPETSWFRFKF